MQIRLRRNEHGSVGKNSNVWIAIICQWVYLTTFQFVEQNKGDDVRRERESVG